MTFLRRISISFLGLIICLLWFELAPMDIWLQELFYDSTRHQWFWSKAEPIGQIVFYDGAKVLLVVFGVSLILALALAQKIAALEPYKRGLRIVLLSLILVPVCVGALKATTNVACPHDLIEFGGRIPYTGIFEKPKVIGKNFSQQRCFPAGHASGGFALLALPFLFRSTRNKRVSLAVATTIGWTMGSYKMVIGDHFLSHTIFTMILAWLIINIIASMDRSLFGAATYFETAEADR